ncbi:hypothetical protein BKA67DRAFT_653293 [Truncatella angustata]|uniref:Uncharacterized protein n=1 Tax=Truncatella angustata TaxID=152316 RepID=A0A9P9A3F3_9PEZI|nr:uncharacterized protein BKA67DRAFT_653293 [Truncatella angustata]KAH6660093.1 hypothetical protein BKA67DRAFT_653293 [Truncatella angustata]KAH8202641.1 hypothetical protein TruAng_003242 [Truncatella angustata]
MAVRSGQDRAKDGMKLPGKRPFRNGQNLFPPPKAVPNYTSRNLPPLPPKSNSASSSIYDSDEGSCRPMPGRFHGGHESPASNRSQSRAGNSTSGGFEGAINEDGMALVRPPSMSIVTDIKQTNHFLNGGYRDVIHSPRPRYPDHKIVKNIELYDELGVSPIISPPTGTFSHQTYEVSPLTPEDVTARGFEQTVSEPELEGSYLWGPNASRRQSRWEDVPPAASHSSLGFHGLPGEEASGKLKQQSQFRYSDPGSPSKTSTASAMSIGLLAPKPYLKGKINKISSSRPQSEAVRVTRRKPTPGASEDTITSPYSMWTRGYGHDKPSPAPSSSSKVSFAINEKSSLSGKPQVSSKAKPAPLYLDDSKTAEEHVKTPYPDLVPPKSAWDYDDEESEKSKRSSWGRSSTKSGKTEGSNKSRGVGKLVSRVKHAGGDVISKLSFTSEELKREKRIEELKGKIQHQNMRSGQKNML